MKTEFPQRLINSAQPDKYFLRINSATDMGFNAVGDVEGERGKEMGEALQSLLSKSFLSVGENTQ